MVEFGTGIAHNQRAEKAKRNVDSFSIERQINGEFKKDQTAIWVAKSRFPAGVGQGSRDRTYAEPGVGRLESSV